MTHTSKPETIKPNFDQDGNEISLHGKWIAGFLLFLFTVLPCVGIVAYWPDRLAKPDEKLAPIYVNEPFHLYLAGIPEDFCCGQLDDSVQYRTPSIVHDTVFVDSTRLQGGIFRNQTTASSTVSTKNPFYGKSLIHINIILLILVGLGGFLGNMVHIATSFTTFIGAGKFRRSWTLWYFIKPFTAAALAIGLYFVFRGGFMNMSDGGSSINLYGLMTISIFTGLFTDKATEKLKEVFEVLFRSRDVRPDALEEPYRVTGVNLSVIEKGKENQLVLAGEHLDKFKPVITINDETIAITSITENSIAFNYSIPSTLNDINSLRLAVRDEKGKELFAADLTVQESNSNTDTTPDEELPVG